MKTYKLESKIGYQWRMHIEVVDGSAAITLNTILAEYAGAYGEEEYMDDEEITALETLDMMVLALATQGIDGFEEILIKAIDTTLNEICNRYGP